MTYLKRQLRRVPLLVPPILFVRRLPATATLVLAPLTWPLLALLWLSPPRFLPFVLRATALLLRCRLTRVAMHLTRGIRLIVNRSDGCNGVARRVADAPSDGQRGVRSDLAARA